MTDKIEAFDARLRENERITALQGQTLRILADDAKQHASAEVVAALEDLTRNGLVPDVAVLKSKMADSNNGDGFWTPIIRTATTPFRAYLDARTGTQITVALLLLFGYLLFTGQLVPIIQALRQPGVEIVVEDGGSVQTDEMDAETVDIEADGVNVNTPDE